MPADLHELLSAAKNQSVTWQTAVAAMNAALSGKGWQYELKDGNSLPTLKKEQ